MGRKRISDQTLFFMISEGNNEALKTLDERYSQYAKKIASEFMNSHQNYGYSFDDYYSAAMLGYCKARNNFQFENSDGFYPYFKIWAVSELKRLNEEGSSFYLNRNPKSFISLDLTSLGDDDGLILCERVGEEDFKLRESINMNELLMKISDSSSGLDEEERVVCSLIALRWDKRDIREYLSLSYKQLYKIIDCISFRLKPYLKELLK